MSKYKYLEKRYFIEHTLTNIFAFILIFISIYFFTKSILPAIMVLAFISSVYSIINNFIFKVNPEIVEISDEEISFESYNRKDVFKLSEINKLILKEYPTAGKIYVRIFDENNKLHRYWVHTKSFQDGKDLFIHLLFTEFKRHPDTLKASSQSAEFFDAYFAK